MRLKKAKTAVTNVLSKALKELLSEVTCDGREKAAGILLQYVTPLDTSVLNK